MRGGRPPPSLSWTVNGSAGCDRDDDDDDDDDDIDGDDDDMISKIRMAMLIMT